MSMIDTPLMRGLERVLDVSAFRHQIIASNLANIDTPGYRTRDVREFAGEIEQAMAGEDEPIPRHAGCRRASFTPVAHQMRGLLERPDGNNVSVERESLLLAAEPVALHGGGGVSESRVSPPVERDQRRREHVMNLFGMLELSGSALGAERQRAEVVASNMANAQTTRTPAGGPYRRQLVVFQAQRAPRFSLALAGTCARKRCRRCAWRRWSADQRPPVMRFEPGHPDANSEGYVAYPQVDPIEEMTDLLGAVRAYELNASAVQATKNMITQSLDLLR